PIDSRVSLKIYNVAGQLVRTLVNETMAAGTHTVTWDGANSNGEKVASGIYFYQLGTENYTQTRKMCLMK
ncbi:MAG TPA: FlgD immunoglobulin-like domain containing protein, partial [Terriglobales bacterium]|nr:FlgD immunoglobulin-like domain containing protein [Terriglobales bacterium]